MVRLYADGRIPMGGKLVTRAATASLTIHLSDANYTGTYKVVVYSGTVGGDAVREVGRIDALESDHWQTLTVALPTAGERFFYLEITEPSPDRMAWTAPIWVERL